MYLIRKLLSNQDAAHSIAQLYLIDKNAAAKKKVSQTNQAKLLKMCKNPVEWER